MILGDIFGVGTAGCNDSRSGVIFLRRPRFFVGDSNRSSGGFTSSEGSISLVFAESIRDGGKMDFWPGKPSMDDGACGIGGSVGRCGGIDEECAITEDVC